jgi:hypothetical protein
MMCDERHIAKRYHGPYIKWMSNPNANPPENWESYLESMVDEDLAGVDNPTAIAHLGVLHSNQFGNHVRRYCEDCQQNSLRGCWLAKCPRCEEVHIYPKHGWKEQHLNCEECQFFFHITDDTCFYLMAFCPICQKGMGDSAIL